jgi:hypothetical protein
VSAMKMSEDYGTCGMIRSDLTTHHPQWFRQVLNKEIISTELPVQSTVLATDFITLSKCSALHTRRHNKVEARSIKHKDYGTLVLIRSNLILLCITFSDTHKSFIRRSNVLSIPFNQWSLPQF